MTKARPIAEATRDRPIIGKTDFGWVQMTPEVNPKTGPVWTDSVTGQDWMPEVWIAIPEEDPS